MTDFEFETMIQYYDNEYKSFLEFNGLTADDVSFDQFIDMLTNRDELYLEM